MRRGDELGADRLRELVADLYEVVHASWSPSDLSGIMRSDVVSDLGEDDLSRYRWTERGGHVIALAMVYLDDGEQWAHLEALDPTAPGAREDVAACCAAVLEDAAGRAADGDSVVFFDQHRTDPHAYPLMRSIPGVGSQAVELLEIPRG